MRKILLILCLFSCGQILAAQRQFQLKSPDGELMIRVGIGESISFGVSRAGETILDASRISVGVDGGKGFGTGSTVKGSKTTRVDRTIEAPFYKRRTIEDRYNELVIHFKEDFDLVLRAYDEAVAYRFVATGKRDFIVTDEQAEFNFTGDHHAFVPYVKSGAEDVEGQYFNSFENLYTYTPLSGISDGKLIFTPIVVELEGGRKVCIAESDLESYPGMFLIKSEKPNSLKANFAPSPAQTVQGGHNMLQQIVTAREPFIARCKAGRKFPWRIVIVSTEDKQLADNDMVYKLAAGSRVPDTSWIKPGKVAWEWWNHWGLSNVGFIAGVNDQTYMAYIDFASANGIEYVILDEGWAVRGKADLFQVVPQINLEKLVAYAGSKGVGLILWAGYWAFDRDMEKACAHYSAMGIKGFKIDFMDRDDQQMVDFHYRAAETAARYKLLVDFHGTYKPTGLNRTYPNVINFEGVHGLEQMKWSGIEKDQVVYDVTMPFIRMVAGPVDYTQGAMRNATRRTYRGINDEPMSQGTRCRQLALYVILDSPLNMLCDSPANYIRETECTAFISSVPTVWDQTVAIDGRLGKYIVMARQKGDAWYVGALTDWNGRSIEIDLSFIGEGDFEAEIFNDGVNADRIASDYVKRTVSLPPDRKLIVEMASGGGFAMKISKKQ